MPGTSAPPPAPGAGTGTLGRGRPRAPEAAERWPRSTGKGWEFDPLHSSPSSCDIIKPSSDLESAEAPEGCSIDSQGVSRPCPPCEQSSPPPAPPDWAAPGPAGGRGGTGGTGPGGSRGGGGAGGRAGPGNSKNGLWGKMLSYLLSVAPPHVGGGLEMPQVQTQALMRRRWTPGGGGSPLSSLPQESCNSKPATSFKKVTGSLVGRQRPQSLPVKSSYSLDWVKGECSQATHIFYLK